MRDLMELGEAERGHAADQFRIISETALAVFGWQDERYKRVLRLLEAGAFLDAALTLVPANHGYVIWSPTGKPTSAAVELPSGDWTSYTPGATPALAIAAAALKAGAQKETSNVR